MRVRDKHFLVVEVVLTAVSLASCALCAYTCLRWARRTHASIVDLQRRVEIAERTCADASGAALAACEIVRAAPSTTDDSTAVAVPLRVQGYGQGRTASGRCYIYADVVLSDGSIDRRRTFLPLRSEGGLQSLPPERALSKPIAPEGAITSLDNSGALCETPPR